MKISDMILNLQNIRDQYGDLPIVGGYLSDDRPPTKITVVDDKGNETNYGTPVLHTANMRPAAGVFIE